MEECEKSVAEVINSYPQNVKKKSLINLQVLADKIYPLQEFRMVKENFLVTKFSDNRSCLLKTYVQRIAKNVENKEVEKWLQDTSVGSYYLVNCF